MLPVLLPPLTCSYTVASRLIFSVGTSNPVSRIPSGPQMRSSTNASNFFPDTFSTTAPRMSELMPYQNRVPGSWASGSFAARLTNSSSDEASNTSSCL